ncbi:hypothetical protein I306_06615 [Cryptococcus gattii EJB2]|uniref:Uncharacterized protein n=1 Tax=Cryptococcus gattii EJB2 TaxID=1296103 RepID=A0ABR5BM35_9TREE|nr:hypothetical protein I306_06615 [Cryptococcus gattii EJB2]
MPPSQKDWPLYAIAQQLNFASKHRVRFAANVDVAKIATSGVWSR